VTNGSILDTDIACSSTMYQVTWRHTVDTSNNCQSAAMVIHGWSQFWHCGLLIYLLPPTSLDYTVTHGSYCTQRESSAVICSLLQFKQETHCICAEHYQHCNSVTPPMEFNTW